MSFSPDGSPGGELVWRVDFLVKYVRPDKEDGIYLPERSMAASQFGIDAEEGKLGKSIRQI